MKDKHENKFKVGDWVRFDMEYDTPNLGRIIHIDAGNVLSIWDHYFSYERYRVSDKVEKISNEEAMIYILEK